MLISFWSKSIFFILKGHWTVHAYSFKLNKGYINCFALHIAKYINKYSKLNKRENFLFYYFTSTTRRLNLILTLFKRVKKKVFPIEKGAFIQEFIDWEAQHELLSNTTCRKIDYSKHFQIKNSGCSLFIINSGLQRTQITQHNQFQQLSNHTFGRYILGTKAVLRI